MVEKINHREGKRGIGRKRVGKDRQKEEKGTEKRYENGERVIREKGKARKK